MSVFDFKAQATQFEGVNAWGMGRAAKLAYEKDTAKVEAAVRAWGFPHVRMFNHAGTQAFLAANPTMLLLAFRGTEPKQPEDWWTDAQLGQVDAFGGEVHRGFKKALDAVVLDVQQQIVTLRTSGQALWVTGHSLGAALAILCVAHLKQQGIPVNGLYTFGAPRVGDKTFAERFNADFVSKTFRFVNNNDVVTRVPPRALAYSHVGTIKYFDAKGNLQHDRSEWQKFLDRLKGRVQDALKPGTDGMKDHGMERYLVCLERCK
jgi:triacylglycerol lipase